MKADEMRQIGRWISQVLHNRSDAGLVGGVRRQVVDLAEAFPLYPEQRAKTQAEARV
jgi:glycine/serine hydroxymethyltransferase